MATTTKQRKAKRSDKVHGWLAQDGMLARARAKQERRERNKREWLEGWSARLHERKAAKRADAAHIGSTTAAKPHG